MTPEGISRVDAERTAAQEGLKQSSLSDAKVYLGGTAATFKDMHDGAKYDLMIAVVSALTLIFMIMLLLTRSLVAALVIVGTAASSIAASFGLSVLIWQDLFGIKIHWIVMALSVIILLAVGSDYNLLLVSRFKEEIHAGLKTGIIRSMAGTGGVVTAAGLVFAFTMASMLGSDLRVLGQFGSTVCIGLLLDTLIVRTLLMPSIATLLGRWFWWPQVVHPRGDNARRPLAAPSAHDCRVRLAASSRQTATAPPPTCSASTGPNGVMIAGSHAGSRRASAAATSLAPSGLATWCTARAAEPSPTTSQTRSIIVAVASLTVRTRWARTSLPSSTRNNGLSASAVPSHALAPPIRPLRRRLSSRCTTMNAWPRDTAELAAAATASRSAPAAAARAAASATKPVPIAADFESMTRTFGSRSAAVRSAAP